MAYFGFSAGIKPVIHAWHNSSLFSLNFPVCAVEVFAPARTFFVKAFDFSLTAEIIIFLSISAVSGLIILDFCGIFSSETVFPSTVIPLIIRINGSSPPFAIAQVKRFICKGEAVSFPCPKEKFASSAGIFKSSAVGRTPPAEHIPSQS